jgi:Coenzyme F420-reducing hydrogenase, gamma subunit
MGVIRRILYGKAYDDKMTANPAEKPAKTPRVKTEKAAKAPKVKAGKETKTEKPAKAAAAPAPVAAPVGKTAEAAPSKLPDSIPLLPGAPPGGKINLAIYWAAACGGCDVSLLDMDERILTVGDMANIVMWPVAADGKEQDIAAMGDGSIVVSIISGAVRNTENEHMVKLLRKKSAIVIAYGTCACFGGTPSLANLTGGKDEILDYVYKQCPTMKAFQDTQKTPVIPQNSWQSPSGELTLPMMYDTVKSLDQVIDVDYFVPGCPPTQESVTAMLAALVGHVYNGAALPPKGAYIGTTDKTLCEECPRTKENRRITSIKEPHEVDVDPNLCLMDQGILCLGPATVGGCGAKCTRAAQPCRGCYGPTPMVAELGASMFTATASLFPVLDEDPTMGEDRAIEIMESIKDPLGYFYAYTMSKSLIKRAVKEKGGE